MGTKSKPFRAFVEGETISDDRKVTPEMIDECVAINVTEVMTSTRAIVTEPSVPSTNG